MNARNNMAEWSPAEHAIYKALQEVEKMGAHLLLTDACIALQSAKESVSEFIVETNYKEG